MLTKSTIRDSVVIETRLIRGEYWIAEAFGQPVDGFITVEGATKEAVVADIVNTLIVQQIILEGDSYLTIDLDNINKLTI